MRLRDRELYILLQLMDSHRGASEKQQSSLRMSLGEKCRVKVWVWVGREQGGFLHCSVFKVGRTPCRQIAYSSLFSILLFSVRPPGPPQTHFFPCV